jgi:signal transduction histidine kinase
MDADRTRLARVIGNHLTNVAKFTLPGESSSGISPCPPPGRTAAR